MRITTISKASGLEALGSEWNSLVEKSSLELMHLRHEWVLSWWNNFGHGSRLNILLAYGDDGALAGIAPFMRASSTYRGIRIKKICLMANGHSPSSGFIIRKELVKEVTERFIEHLFDTPGWDLLELTKIEDNGDTDRIVSDFLEKRKCLHGRKSSIETPVVRIDGDWETFFSNKPQKFKKGIRNKLNRIGRIEGIKIDEIRIRDGNDPALQDLIQISARSWKKENGMDLLGNRNSRGFHFELCDRLGPQGMITLWLLRKGPEPVAFEFHIRYKDVVYPIRADYDESFGDLSPGSVLEYNILKGLFEGSGAREYYTCGHTYKYLLNWSTEVKKHITIEAFNRSYKSFSLHSLEYRLMPVLRKLNTGIRQKFLR